MLRLDVSGVAFCNLLNSGVEPQRAGDTGAEEIDDDDVYAREDVVGIMDHVGDLVCAHGCAHAHDDGKVDAANHCDGQEGQGQDA